MNLLLLLSNEMVYGLFSFFMFLFLFTSGDCLKLLKVIVPTFISRGENAILECHYELEGDSLYSVKWYKENEEFYRYVPKSRPPVTSYKIDGVKVDHERSDSRKVYLKSVTLKSTGSYKCEVSAEAPFFSSAQKEGKMQVVYLSKSKPEITGSKPDYQNGEILDLNCTSGKSYPRTTLRWYINDQLVGHENTIEYTSEVSVHGLITSIVGIRLIINSEYFKNGIMKVRCVATLSSLKWMGDQENILQRMDNKESSLLVRGSSMCVNCHNRNWINLIMFFVVNVYFQLFYVS